MKKLPIGIQRFARIIEEEYLYIDKTRQIYDLISQGYLYFLSRPSKFSKLSIFSGLNNLTDITIEEGTADLVGITNEELTTYFAAYIQQSSKKLGMTPDFLLQGLQTWCSGYSFDGKTFLYNPFSLLNFFSKNKFGNFWFETGTPTFLVNALRTKEVDPTKLESLEVTSIFFANYSIENLDIYGVLFQAGYLTIKSTRQKGWRLYYTLGYPNEETRQAFVEGLLPVN